MVKYLGSNLVFCCSSVRFRSSSQRDYGALSQKNIMEMLGPFQVLPLKMLVTRQVIRERMEYKDYLGGIAKDELDRLDWFEGKFIVHSAPMEVRRKGKILTNNEWESLKSLGVRGEKLPRAMIAFLDAKKTEFSILERSNRHGKREWELQDVDGSSKKLDLSSTVKNDPMGPVHGGWSYTEKYIDDGKLTKWRSLIHPKGEVMMGALDSFGIDREGNVFRCMTWFLPTIQTMIIKNMWTRREENVP